MKKTQGTSFLYSEAGFFSRIFFFWVQPVLSLGYQKYLTLEDVPMVSKEFLPGVLVDPIEKDIINAKYLLYFTKNKILFYFINLM